MSNSSFKKKKSINEHSNTESTVQKKKKKTSKCEKFARKKIKKKISPGWEALHETPPRSRQ